MKDVLFSLADLSLTAIAPAADLPKDVSKDPSNDARNLWLGFDSREARLIHHDGKVAFRLEGCGYGDSRTAAKPVAPTGEGIYQSGPATLTTTVANNGGIPQAGAGTATSSTVFHVYALASARAAAWPMNSVILTDSSDTVTTGSQTTSVTVCSQLSPVDSKFTHMALRGGTVNNPRAAHITLSGGDSASTGVTTVASDSGVTFTFNIQLANCSTFTLAFDVRGN